MRGIVALSTTIRLEINNVEPFQLVKLNMYCTLIFFFLPAVTILKYFLFVFEIGIEIHTLLLTFHPIIFCLCSAMLNGTQMCVHASVCVRARVRYYMWGAIPIHFVQMPLVLILLTLSIAVELLFGFKFWPNRVRVIGIRSSYALMFSPFRKEIHKKKRNSLTRLGRKIVKRLKGAP